MLRVPLNKPYLQRTIKVNYGWTQATPQGKFLDPAWDRSVDIWPGMVAMKTTGDLVSLVSSAGVPLGFFGNYVGGDGIDELLASGINACAVWVLGPDAEMTVLAPAFDTTASWTDPGDGTVKLISASVSGANRGKLVPQNTLNSSRAIARLIRVDSASQIVIGGLQTGDVGAARGAS
jgi:hypothetical protein